MAETAPRTPEEVWSQRLDRAGGLTAPAVVDLYHRILDEHASDRSGRRAIDDDPEPARELWAEFGRRLGIGPPPPGW